MAVTKKMVKKKKTIVVQCQEMSCCHERKKTNLKNIREVVEDANKPHKCQLNQTKRQILLLLVGSV